MDWAVKQRPKTPLEKLVLMVLADRHNATRDQCNPSIATIADDAICSKRGAINALASLEKQGYIEVKRMHRRNSNYVLKVHSVHPKGENLECTQCTHRVHSVHPTGELSAPQPGKNQEKNQKEPPNPPRRGAGKKRLALAMVRQMVDPYLSDSCARIREQWPDELTEAFTELGGVRKLSQVSANQSRDNRRVLIGLLEAKL